MQEAKDNGRILYLQFNIIGDEGCGKTSLINAYAAKNFTSVFSVSRYARYKLTKINNIPVEMVLNDFIGLEDFDDTDRSLLLMFSNINILCYSVDSRESFNNISNKWWPEIKGKRITKPHILVGLKKDCRTFSAEQDGNAQLQHVTSQEGKAVAKSIGAVHFLECSSVNNEGISSVFETAMTKCYEEIYGKLKKNNDKAWKSLLCCWNV